MRCESRAIRAGPAVSTLRFGYRERRRHVGVFIATRTGQAVIEVKSRELRLYAVMPFDRHGLGTVERANVDPHHVRFGLWMKCGGGTANRVERRPDWEPP